jgi:hypothetical protein
MWTQKKNSEGEVGGKHCNKEEEAIRKTTEEVSAACFSGLSPDVKRALWGWLNTARQPGILSALYTIGRRSWTSEGVAHSKTEVLERANSPTFLTICNNTVSVALFNCRKHTLVSIVTHNESNYRIIVALAWVQPTHENYSVIMRTTLNPSRSHVDWYKFFTYVISLNNHNFGTVKAMWLEIMSSRPSWIAWPPCWVS